MGRILHGRARRVLRPAPAAALAAALALGLLGAGAAQEPAQPVTVQADRAEGRLVAESLTNISCGDLYGQVTSTLSDAAFQWARATGALAYVRCYNWLGDGIPRDRPGWFSGCRVAGSGPAGEIQYRWEGLERVLDTLVASGLKPVIVCAGLPDVLADGPIRRNESGAAVNPPRDYGLYQEMLTQMFRRLVKTYGAAEVRTWYFEVWSQPDHEGSWSGGRAAPFTEELPAARVAAFNRLYDHFAAAAGAVDERIRVGGPGLAGDLHFLRHFLRHCTGGTNAATGKRGTRLDFLSWHRYGTVTNILRWNEELRGMVAAEFPQLEGTRTLLSECGSGAVEGARSATAYEAARMAALLDGNARAARGVDMLFRAGDLVDDHFDGFRPLITRVGENTVPLPAFRLYSLLSKMGGDRVRAEAPAGVGVLATRPSDASRRSAVQALLYRYDPSLLPGQGTPMPLRVRVSGLPTNLLRLPMRLYRIDPETCAPHAGWEAAGRPRPGSGGGAALLALGRKLAGSPLFATPAEVEGRPLMAGDALFAPARESPGIPVNGGAVELDVTLPPNSVAMLTLGAEPAYGVDLCPRGERLRRAEEEAAAAVEQGRTPGGAARVVESLRRIQNRYADTYWREVALYALTDLYENELKAPDQAEAARRELLALPVDDFFRVRLLERLRVDAARRGDTGAVRGLSAQIAALESSLAALRKWPLTRYTGQ